MCKMLLSFVCACCFAVSASAQEKTFNIGELLSLLKQHNKQQDSPFAVPAPSSLKFHTVQLSYGAVNRAMGLRIPYVAAIVTFPSLDDSAADTCQMEFIGSYIQGHGRYVQLPDFFVGATVPCRYRSEVTRMSNGELLAMYVSILQTTLDDLRKPKT